MYFTDQVKQNQTNGLFSVFGYALPAAKASASIIMFNMDIVVITMCKNLITLIRESFLHKFIPFDSAITMHKISAWMVLLFSGNYQL